MSVHLHKELNHIKKKLLTLSAKVEDSLQRAINCLVTRDARSAKEIMDVDRLIDEMEIEIEEDCLKIFALYQPVAVDLRFLVAVLKINNDLERIGDLTQNIAERALQLAMQPNVEIPDKITGIATKSIAMLKKSIDSLINLDAALSREVCLLDDEVDELNRTMYNLVKERIRRNPEQIDSLIHLLSVSRYLERIADHTTNIAEDIIYMIEGEIIRHRFGV